MHPHVWLENMVPFKKDDHSLPPIMLSKDISLSCCTNPIGHTSRLWISCIVIECFRLQLSNVRWFVLSGDDSVSNVVNLVTVLGKYNPFGWCIWVAPVRATLLIPIFVPLWPLEVVGLPFATRWLKTSPKFMMTVMRDILSFVEVMTTSTPILPN